MDNPVELAIVVASVRPERIGPVVADWLMRLASARSDFTATKIDLLDYRLPSDLSPSAGSAALAESIGSSDAVVVVTPEYNHGYPGSLKNAFDSVKYEWRGKPIGFVSYGGLSGGMRATEQLRQVAAELHMVSVRDSVAVHRVRRAFDAQGNIGDGPVVDSAARMLDQLQWWATATKNLQAIRAYPGQ